jgi:hypothetical protein
MCGGCVRYYIGDTEVDLSKPEIQEAAGLVAWVYAQDEYGVGGPLHVQLDDFNLEDRHLTANSLVWWTRGYPAREGIREFPAPAPDGFPEGHEEKFLRLLELLRGMSEAERAAAVWIGHGRTLASAGIDQ